MNSARFISYNANPQSNRTGDCVIRAVSKLLGYDWERTYIELCLQGFIMADMPNSNHVWGAYLKNKGFKRAALPNECPDCYTVRDFCEDNPHGRYLMAISGHVVAVINGEYYDTWDSGDEVPVYYWYKED